MSEILNKLKFKTVVSFELYPASILGASIKEAEVLAILDKQTANQFGDMDTLHRNVYPTLPSTTVDDPDLYQYVKLRLSNGTTKVIGLPWIIEDSIVVSAVGRLELVFDNVTPEDRDIILRGIAANGYTVSSAKLT